WAPERTTDGRGPAGDRIQGGTQRSIPLQGDRSRNVVGSSHGERAGRVLDLGTPARHRVRGPQRRAHPRLHPTRGERADLGAGNGDHPDGVTSQQGGGRSHRRNGSLTGRPSRPELATAVV